MRPPARPIAWRPRVSRGPCTCSRRAWRWTCTTCTAKRAAAPEDQPLKQLDFEELAAYVNAHSVGRAIILGGDTNLHTDEAFAGGIWQTFRSATGIVDVCDTVDCGSDADDIDKFAYRSSDTLEIEPLSHDVESDKFTYSGGALSDHEPLAVRFRWAPK